MIDIAFKYRDVCAAGKHLTVQEIAGYLLHGMLKLEFVYAYPDVKRHRASHSHGALLSSSVFCTVLKWLSE